MIDELLNVLNKASIRYLLIGGQAMRLLGMPRYSMDWDFFIPPSDLTNLAKLNTLLEGELDMILEPLGPSGENFVQTYQTRWGVLQFHLIVPGLKGFDASEIASVNCHTERGTPVKCISGRDLLAAKLAAGRAQDQLDIEFLRELEHLGKL